MTGPAILFSHGKSASAVDEIDLLPQVSRCFQELLLCSTLLPPANSIFFLLVQ